MILHENVGHKISLVALIFPLPGLRTMCRFPSHINPADLLCGGGKARQIRQKVEEMRQKLVGRDQHPPGILRGNHAAFEQGIILFLFAYTLLYIEEQISLTINDYLIPSVVHIVSL